MTELDRKRSLLENLKDGEIIKLEMTDQEIFVLVTILAFAGETARYASEQELVKGTPQAAKRLKAYAMNAESLLIKVYDSIEYGERPPLDQLN